MTADSDKFPNPSHNSGQHAADEIAAYAEALRRGETPFVGLRTTARAGGNQELSWRECVELLQRAYGGGHRVPHANIPEKVGRFHIERELGHGGFGVVYLAWDPKLNRNVAVKVPNFRARVSSQLRDRFKHEALIGAAFDHPNIIPVHEAVPDDEDECYIVSAYCEGQNLSQWLKEQKANVSSQTAAAIVVELADAVSYIHARNVLHRDLKPNNVLLAPLDRENVSHTGQPFTPRL